VEFQRTTGGVKGLASVIDRDMGRSVSFGYKSGRYYWINRPIRARGFELRYALKNPTPCRE